VSSSIARAGQVSGIRVNRGASGHFEQRRITARNHRGAALHGFDDGESEAFVHRRIDQRQRTAVEFEQAPFRHLAREMQTQFRLNARRIGTSTADHN
jgi:hypothetical protein